MKVSYCFNFLSAGLLIACSWWAQPAVAQTTVDDWIWSRAGGGVDVLSAVYEAPVINSRGEIILCGLFQADAQIPMTFDSSAVQVFPAASMRKTAFLGKYGAEGTLQWAQSFRSGEVLNLLMTIDRQDNIYLAGSVTDFLEVDTVNLVPSNADDPFLFLIKLNDDGALIWAKIVAETQPSTDPTIFHHLKLKSVKADPDGQIVLLGEFDQPAVIVGDSAVSQTGYNDVFVTKLDANGEVQWMKGVGAAGWHEFAHEMAIDLKGNSYISTTYQPVDVVVDPIKTVIAKIDPFGNTLWTDTINPGSHPNGLGYLQLHVGPDNYLYTVATYKGSFSIQHHTLPQGDHLLISKISPDGQYDWVQTTGSTSVPDPTIFPVGIACDREGIIYVTGTYVESLVAPVTDLGIDTIQLINQGGRDLFFLKLEADGSLLFADNVGGTNNDGVGGMALDQKKNAYLTGYSNSDQLVFNHLTQINPSAHDNTWSTNFFLVKFGETLPTGIIEHEGAPALRIFPNPARSNIQLDCAYKLERVSITDVQGRLLYEKIFGDSGYDQEINIKSLSAGNYFLKAKTSGGPVVRKITIVR